MTHDMTGNKTIWMARGESGRLFDEFRDRKIAAIGWWELRDFKPGDPKSALIKHYAANRPEFKEKTILSGASQVWRFLNEVRVGDWVLTYHPGKREYLVGEIKGPAKPEPELQDIGIALSRKTDWFGSLSRDVLSATTKNSLGSTLTLFKVPENASLEVQRVLASPNSQPSAKSKGSAPEVVGEAGEPEGPEALLQETEARAQDFIQDRIAALDWAEMQELVAGILRAMGYKTRVSKPGADRGVDVFASPDGLGFETPRIVVEVKHRQGQVGSKEIRSFLGGRHKDDRGLYVSTGGFTRDARYEAERAAIPVTLWESEDLARYLIDHYEQADNDTRQLIPLKRIYWPV